MAARYKFNLPNIAPIEYWKARSMCEETGRGVEPIQHEHRLNELAAHFETDVVTVGQFAELIQTREAIARKIHLGKDQFSAMAAVEAHRWGDESAAVIVPANLVTNYLQQLAVAHAKEDFKSWLSENEKALEAASVAVDKFASEHRIKAK